MIHIFKHHVPHIVPLPGFAFVFQAGMFARAVGGKERLWRLWCAATALGWGLDDRCWSEEACLLFGKLRSVCRYAEPARDGAVYSPFSAHMVRS